MPIRTSSRPMGQRDVARRPQVVELGAQPPVGACLLAVRTAARRSPRRPRGSGRGTAPRRPSSSPRERSSSSRKARTVNSSRYRPVGGVGDQQRRVDEVVQHGDRVVRQRAPRRRRGPRRRGTARSLAAAPAPGRASAVRRADRRAQRALPVVAGGGQVQGAVEPLADGVQRHHGDLTGGQLDAERQSVEAAQHLDQVRDVSVGHVVARVPAAGVLEERAYAGLSPQRRRGRSSRAAPAGAGAGRRTPPAPGG